MKQRLCLARSLAHDPRVLILDEPASGLDPRARIEIRELLRELCSMGKTIFFSSHILSEVADICTHIGVIEDGRLVAAGNMEEMQRRLRPQRAVRMRLLGEVEARQAAKEALFHLEGVTSIQDPPDAPGEIVFDFGGDDANLSAVLTTLVTDHGLRIVSFSEESGGLEDVFLQVTQGIVS
jgi:ABC-2 type transport system ATP-binding protein